MPFDRATRSVVGVLVCLSLIAGASRAGAQAPNAASEPVCSLDPGIAELLERCATGDEAGSACALARVARALVAADEGAAMDILQQDLGFDAAGASDLLSAFRLLTLFAIGPSEPMSPCAVRASLTMMKVMEVAMAGFPIEAWLVLWPILGWEEPLLAAIESRVDPERIEPLRKARAGIETYIKASSYYPPVGNDQSEILWKLIAGGEHDLGALTSSPPPPADAAQILRQGVVDYSAGRQEEAVRELKQAVEAMEAMDDSDLRTRTHLRFARWLRILAFEEMGQMDHAKRLRAELGVSDHPLDQALDDIVRMQQRDETVGIHEIWSRLIAYVWDDPTKATELEAFFETLAEVIPGMAGLSGPGQANSPSPPPVTRPEVSAESSPDLSSSLSLGGEFPRMTTGVAAEIVKGQYDVAAQKALDLLDHFPRLSNLGLLFLVVQQQALSGDREGALTNSLKGLDRLEGLTATMQVEELRRSFIDEKGYLLYRLVFGLAAEMGETDIAFEVIERGRAWDMRVRWGALLTSQPTPKVPEPMKVEALGELAAHEAGGEPSNATQRESWLARRSELRDDFRHQRLERILDQSLDDEGRSVRVPDPPPLSKVRDQLPDGWSLVVYASYEDTLWAFLVGHEQETSLHKLPIIPAELETLMDTVDGSSSVERQSAEFIERCRTSQRWRGMADSAS